MTVIEDTKYLMHTYNIHPNKGLGQNFLIDEEALNLIASNVDENDTIIEIGPGLGTLTNIMLNKAKKVIAVEIDPKMVEIIRDRFKLYKNLEIIHDDVLDVDINSLAPKAKVVANLPYYITTSIVTKIIKSNVQDITLLIQKEVADRICAKPGSKNAGAITYYINYYSDATIVGKVSKESFIPPPKVESAIINLKKLELPREKVEDEKLMFELIKENFAKRRKTITNSLSNCIAKEKLIPILNKLGISEKTRGEELTLKQFAQISNEIKKL